MIGAFRLNSLGANLATAAPAWMLRYYGAGVDNSTVSSSCTDTDGNYYLSILTTSPTLIGSQDVLVLKIDAAGTILWKTRLGKSATVYTPRGMVVTNGFVHVMMYQGTNQQITFAALDVNTGSVAGSQYITTISTYSVVASPNTSNSGLSLSKVNPNSVVFAVTAGTVASTSFCYIGSFTFAGTTYTNSTTGHGSNQTAYLEIPYGGVTNAQGYFAKVYTASAYVFVSYNSISSVSDTRYLNTIGTLADLCGSNESTSGCNITFLSTSTNPVVTKLNTDSWSYTAKSIMGGVSAGKVYTTPDNSMTYVTVVASGTVKSFYLLKFDANLNIVWQIKIANSVTTTIPVITSINADNNSVYVNVSYNFGTGGGNQNTDSVTFKLPTDGSKTGAFTMGGSTWTIGNSTDLGLSSFTLTISTLGSTDTGQNVPFSVNNPFLSSSTNGLTPALTGL